MKRTLTSIAAFALVSSSALAGDHFDLVEVDSQHLFVPSGFDDNDEVVVVLDGYMNSGCYKIDDVQADVDQATKTIAIRQFARRYSQPCIQALVPFTSEVRLGTLAMGDYQVSANNSALQAKLGVDEAASAGPDNFFYAPISSVTVETVVDSATNEEFHLATLDGRFTNDCMIWEDVKVIDQGDATVVIKPIIKMDEDADECNEALVPFRKQVKVETNKNHARRLLHTRSLNGRSINVVFE